MSKIIEINKEDSTHIILTTSQKSNIKLEPLKELYKGKLFTNLSKSFQNDCLNQFGSEIFSIKKSQSRTLANLLACWIFSLYMTYDFSDDYFLPSNYSNTKILEDTLKDFCKYNDKIIDVDNKINKIINKLKIKYKFCLESLKTYSDSVIFKQNKNNYQIKKSIINILKNKNLDTEMIFYKFQIIINFPIRDKKLINILDNILLPIKIYDRLVNLYSGPIELIDEYLWAIIFRYQLLSSNNHQLAVLPNIMKTMTKDYNLNFECFASAINSTYPNYCSIYYDLEQYFGSVGNFFSICPIKGTYGFNPPYQKNLIETGIKKLFVFLDNTDDSLSFIITIPIWDNSGKEYMKNIYNNEFEKQTIDYGDFTIIAEIQNSKYFRGLRMIAKNDFTYIDHNFELYKNKTIQNTYVILLSNQPIDISIMNSYSFNL
jgi:hypothetical protein